jgi:uncharacterized protein
MHSAREWIETLHLVPHVEGGYFGETYRSEDKVTVAPDRTRNEQVRALCSAIYFLLEAPSISHLHRLKSDELWYFHDGSPLIVHSISPDGEYKRVVLGADPSFAYFPQLLVQKGAWIGAAVEEEHGYSLVSCMVVPAFEYSDFELADRQKMIGQYPQFEEIIRLLTRVHVDDARQIGNH